METAEVPLLILGWCCLLFGVTELINALKIRSLRKQADRMAEELQRAQQLETGSEAEEISSEINDESNSDEYDEFSAD